MADDERKGFWRRLKDKLTGGQPAPDPQQEELPADNPGQDTQHEAPALRADKQQKPPAEPVDPTPADEPKTPTPSPAPPAEDKEPSVVSTSELKTDNVGRVYAEALLELAQDQGIMDVLAEEIQSLLPIIAEGGELHRLLTNPAISDEERGKIVQAVFQGKVSGLLYNLLRLLGDKCRLGSLPQVAAGYLLAVAEARGQVDVVAYVATALDPAVAKQVGDQIGQALGKTVTLNQKVDPALIGGMKIKVGDQLIDASVASQLRNMKNKMIAAGRA